MLQKAAASEGAATGWSHVDGRTLRLQQFTRPTSVDMNEEVAAINFNQNIFLNFFT